MWKLKSVDTCFPENHQANKHLTSELIDQAISFLLNTNKTLEKQSDLSPNNPIVNNTLSTLVDQLTQWSTDKAFQTLDQHEKLDFVSESLPEHCAIAECEMEKWWLRKLCSNPASISESIKQFWYIQHYQNLVHTELALLESVQPQKVVFLGCGALPLTATILANELPSTRIRCVDYDKEAYLGATKFIERYQLQHQIEVLNNDASEFNAEADELVICASLLRAPTLYQRLHAQEVEHLIIRDSEGVFRFLYKAANLPSNSLYKEVDRSSNCHQRINISRLFKRT